jgi:hypothetical protein
MEKEEEKIVDPTVDTVDNNVVDDNTELDSSDYTPELPGTDVLTGDPVVDAPVEDPTLATTDEVIPAQVGVPGEEPVTADPFVDIDNPPMDTIIPEDPSALAPAEPVDAPVENPEAGIVGPGPEAATVDAGCACGDPGCDGTCGVEPTPCESPVTVANFFGTLQECVTIVWRFHLKTRKHHIHVDLGDFYQGALYKVDKIIEEYQGIVGIIEEPFTNCVVGDGKTEGEYLTELKAFIENNRCVVGGHPEIDSSIDDFLGLIDSTLYKITSFTESAVKSFEEFVYEDFNESCCYNDSEDDDAEEE